MIKRYHDYLIIEGLKTNVELLLEGTLSGTSEFMNKLVTISKQGGRAGKVAKTIREFIDREVWIDDDEIKQNFFNVTDKEEMVSFIMQSKIPDNWDDEGDPSLPYNIKGRGDIKVGKLIRYIIQLMQDQDEINTDDIPKDKDIEEFVNVYKSTKQKDNLEFKLINGDDIAKYYNSKKYLLEIGSLGGSCMSGERKSTFKIYSKNEDKVQLLVLIDEKEDKITGRALLWKLSESPCEAKYFMDRVYTNRDSDFFKFRQYAEEKGYLYKKLMNSHKETNVLFIHKGQDVVGRITVKIAGDHANYPFVDTLCFLRKDRKELSNLSSEGCYILQELDGGTEECIQCDGTCLQEQKIKTKFMPSDFCYYCSEGWSEIAKRNLPIDIKKIQFTK